MSCAAHCSDSAGHFDRRRAEQDRARYRRHGPDRTTRLILESLTGAGRTLLDVGGGIGILGLELLQAGIQRIVLVDASAAGLDVARQMYAERGGSERLETRLGDFAELQSPEADLVTLDRVVCCYPDYAGLLRRAANAAGEVLVLSYPRDRWFVRLGNWIENLPRHWSGSAFRTFIHPVPEMHAVLEGSGLRMASRRNTPAWCVERWTRADNRLTD